MISDHTFRRGRRFFHLVLQEWLNTSHIFGRNAKLRDKERSAAFEINYNSEQQRSGKSKIVQNIKSPVIVMIP